jgi:hypothetical protein
MVYVLGAENRKTIDRIRGIPRICYLAWDEQSIYDHELQIYALGSVIQPALADEQGRLVLMGTGGPPRGPWFNIITYGNAAGEGERDFVVIRNWTWWDNPKIRNPDGELGKVCRLRGVLPSDPYVRREVGSKEHGIEFTTDSTRSVFPRIVARPLELLPGGRYLIGGDVGSVDKSAVAVYWLLPHYDGLVLVASEKRETKGTTDQLAFFREWLARYSALSSQPVLLALDPGGGGKAVLEDLVRLAGFFEVMSAEKFDKAINCRLMADDIRSGFLTVLPGNTAATEGLETLEWEPGKEGQKLRGHADDAADGAIYGWRLAKQRFSYSPPVQPGTAENKIAEELFTESQQIHDLGF